MENIAVIPARGGSKRIPRKNIKPFCGKPVIAWAIAIAANSRLFDRIVVSTDDPEIAEVAREFGAEVPFVRPSELSDDQAGTVPVIAHATKALGGEDRVRFVCCIYPCTPLLQPDDLRQGFAMLRNTGADFVYPVVEYAHPTYRAMRRTAAGAMEFVFPECELKRTQDLEPTYHDAGQFYWGKSDAWLAHKRMHTAGLGMVVPSWRFVDIDSENDWNHAEVLFHALFSKPMK